MVHLGFVVVPALFAAVARAQYTATYLPSNVPAHTEEGQIGTNQCGTANGQDSLCQNLYINSVTDFCLWAPPYLNGKNPSVGETEQIEVLWCIKPGYGTRLIPDGTIKGAHFVQTPDYVQVNGWGDFTKMNIPANDEGGELDPHGADGMGNPHGGLVFGSSFGKLRQFHEWTNFISATEFCGCACKDAPNAAKICNHIYDVMGCEWNMPGNYAQGVFENCVGNSAQAMGINGSSTFHQGDPATPAAHPAPGSNSCSGVSTIGNAPVTTSVASTSTSAVESGSTVVSSAASATSTAANGAVSSMGGLGLHFGVVVSVGMSVAALLFGVCVAV